MRRNLGSALERAEASEASRAAGVETEAASSLRVPEVQSRLAGASFGAAAGAAAAAGATAAALERGGSGRQLLERGASGRQALAVPPAVLDLHADLASPDSEAQSSLLSAGGDPAAPFSVPPSTHRRFAQRGEDGGGGGARRWAWRREGAAGAGGGALFQRARIASVGKHDSDDGAAAGTVAALGVEASTASATSASSPAVELSSRRGTSEEAAAAAAAAAPPGAAAGDAGDAAPGPTAFAGAGPALSMPRASFEASAAAAAAARGRSQRLLPGLSLLDSLALPSPVDQPTPYASQPLVEALALELRSLAALEVCSRAAGCSRLAAWPCSACPAFCDARGARGG